MSNRLSMAQTQAIQALTAAGKSQRAISRDLGIDRGTVAKTLSQFQNQPPIWEAPTGFGGAPAESSTGDVIAEDSAAHASESDAATCPAGITGESSSKTDGTETAEPAVGSRSECEAHRDEIIRKLEQGLTAQRIWQDLVDEYGFAAKYHSVRRYVARLQKKTPQLVRQIGRASCRERV